MAKAPAGFEWNGFTSDQTELLDFLDHLGNNGWARNGQTEEVMPKLMQKFADAGISLARVKEAMAEIGYDKDDLHQLERWESKRTTGHFGR
jgi:hypothetical protein